MIIRRPKCDARTLAAKSAAEKTPPVSENFIAGPRSVPLGAILGHLYPDLSVYLKPYGTPYQAIKVVVARSFLLTIVVGIAKMGDIRRSQICVKGVIYIRVASTLALIIGTDRRKFLEGRCRPQCRPGPHSTPRRSRPMAKVAKNVNLTDFFLFDDPTSLWPSLSCKVYIMPVLFIAVLRVPRSAWRNPRASDRLLSGRGIRGGCPAMVRLIM